MIERDQRLITEEPTMHRNSDLKSLRCFAQAARWLSLIGSATGGVFASFFLCNHSASSAESLPVRVNRTFFENPYLQSIQITVNDVPLIDKDGRGTWMEQQTALPSPAPNESTGPILADFRDFKACSSSDNTPNVRICFNVMPDVSSVGLNSREASIEGLEEAVPSQCRKAASQITFKSATRSATPELYIAEFASKPTPDSPASPCNLTLKVTLRKGILRDT